LRFHLGALSKRETHEYITHRLNVAGANGRTIFDEAACDMVFRYAGGIPRLVNLLCDTAMLCAFAEERATIDEGLVKAAAEELQWVEFTERIREHERQTERTGQFANGGTLPLGRLEVLYRDQLVGEFPVKNGRTIIGRTPDNDVQIESRFISRHHAQLISDQSQSVVEDLNSTNGVFIRSQRVKQHALSDGDIIQIGEHKLLYRDMRGTGRHSLVPADDDDFDDDEEDEDYESGSDSESESDDADSAGEPGERDEVLDESER
jgi:general secretion pathway protein A